MTLTELHQRESATFAAYLDADTFAARGVWLAARRRLQRLLARQTRDEARQHAIEQQRRLEAKRRYQREWCRARSAA